LPDGRGERLKRRVVTNVVATNKFDWAAMKLTGLIEWKVDPTSSQPWCSRNRHGYASWDEVAGLTEKDVDRMFGATDAKDLAANRFYARLDQDLKDRG
jgi:hypothetical protein